MADLSNLDGMNMFGAGETGDFEPLPPAVYLVSIRRSELRDTKSGTGRYLWLEMEVIQGEHQGRKLWDRLNLENPSQRAREIGWERLEAISRAVGIEKPKNSAELHDRPLKVRVDVEQSERYGPSNRVQRYMPAKANVEAGNGSPLVRPWNNGRARDQ